MTNNEMDAKEFFRLHPDAIGKVKSKEERNMEEKIYEILNTLCSKVIISAEEKQKTPYKYIDKAKQQLLALLDPVAMVEIDVIALKAILNQETCEQDRLDEIAKAICNGNVIRRKEKYDTNAV